MLAEGDEVHLSFDPAAAHLFDAGSGARLPASADNGRQQPIATESGSRKEP
jgi:hypothetical protein